MCYPAVRVLQQSISVKKPWHVTANPTPIKIDIATDSDPHILLPVPVNSNSMEYTKPEAVFILLRTRKGSPIKGKMIRKMIWMGYTPTIIRTIQLLLQLYDDGKIILDDPWDEKPIEELGSSQPLPNTCKSIQSRSVDKQAPFILNIIMD